MSVNANTVAALDWAQNNPDVQEWGMSTRRQLVSRLRSFAVESGRMSPKNADECVDWSWVADNMFLADIQGLEDG